MSERIPESIPTSQDPRSKRPLKKRALTPVSEQASTISALFAKPDQEIRLPTSTSLGPKSAAHAPPEIVANVQGSSAGAGSGEFHVYKASRRREYERLRQMDEEVKTEKEGEEFERERREREERDREKTRRNREKREKMKMRKGKKGGAMGMNGDKDTNGPAGTGVKAPRADIGGPENRDQMHGDDGEENKVVEEVGVIIHDDD